VVQNIKISILLLVVGCIVGSCQNNPPKTEQQKAQETEQQKAQETEQQKAQETEQQKKQEKLQEELSSLDIIIESTITEIKNDPEAEEGDKTMLELVINSEVFFEKIFDDAKKSMEKLAQEIEDCEKEGRQTLYGYKPKTVVEAKKELEFSHKKLKFLGLIVEKNKKEKELLNSLPKK
jgi:hypothetical protein